MRQLTFAAFLSLDGVMQAPGGPDEDTSDGFAHGGWIVPYADGSGEVMGGALAQPFELVLGRRTYDIFAGYWPHVSQGAPHRGIADQFNGTVKHVATHHPTTLAWQHSQALGTDVVTALRDLKRAAGPDLLILGSSDLMQQLLATDLVDTLRLLVYPVVLGRGKRLFDGNALPSAFRLAASTTLPTGVLVTRYERDGAVKTGAFNPA
ncbi:dihydrofolate reductase family protein [Cupriavidus pauculus]|uniref:Dihydrofolate reductase n=1 Tax=Cupriavidus pauculus TaxID=82633 RepID=A0A2N5C5Z9_9BURK|nr:dihydrofolate reductase family protein [Cupriavidus pauculus]PLP97610.1 dihydrofolate reductase [Cupriavidus pauculus]